MTTAAMKAAIKQYSIAVTPRLSQRSASNVRKSLSTVRYPLPTETDDQSASFIFLFYGCLFKEDLIPPIFLQVLLPIVPPRMPRPCNRIAPHRRRVHAFLCATGSNGAGTNPPGRNRPYRSALTAFRSRWPGSCCWQDMTRLAYLVVLLALAIDPRAGVADTLAFAPARPSIQGLNSLFRSPPPQVIRVPAPPSSPSSPANPAPLMPARSPPPTTLGTNTDGAICRPALIAAETRHGIPAGLLQAIGIVESGRRDPLTGKTEPWPWTINADGEPHVFDSKQQAVAWVRQAQGRGVQSIDVGCAQVNLMYHPTAFTSLEQAFDPAANADYAARFLRELWESSASRNWMTAAGQYHSQTPELAEAYREQVKAAMAGGAMPNAQMPAFASAANTMAPFASAGPLRSFGGVRSQPVSVPAAASGTLGRGLDAYRAMPIRMALVGPLRLTGAR